MRNMLLASAALIAMVGQAEAQDAGYNWSGFYVGAQVGYGWSHADFSGSPAIPSGDHDENGFVGGVHVGHDWQAGSFVYGVLADVDYVNVDEFNLNGVTAAQPPFGGKEEDYAYDVDWLATARVRAGFLPTDRILVYGTGGLAVAGIETSGRRETLGRPFTDEGSDVEIGGVIGAGVEFALAKNWSVKTEYLHYDFNTATIDVGLPDNPRFDPSMDTVKVGFSFRFGS